MAESSSAPRRVRVERAIYRRPTGVLEICFKDEAGRLRWRTVDGGILAARKLRDDIAARKARGDQVAPNPKLRFGEAANAWLTGPVLDLRDTTQVKYRSIVDGHLRPRLDARRLDAITADDLACLVRDLRAERKSEADDRSCRCSRWKDLQIRHAAIGVEWDEPYNIDAVVRAAEGLAGEAPPDLRRGTA